MFMSDLFQTSGDDRFYQILLFDTSLSDLDLQARPRGGNAFSSSLVFKVVH